MVDTKQTAKGEIVMTILRKAETDGTFQGAAEYQEVTLKEVEDKLSGITTFEDQMELLQDEYPCLYFLVSSALGIDTSEYRDFCKQFKENMYLFTYYIHGFLYPEYYDLRVQ